MLSYSISKEYTIPHLNAYLFIISVIAIPVLVVLNVALQGYNVVAELHPDPNTIQPYWWSVVPFLIRSPGRCNPVSLSKGLKFSTNFSLFSYEFRSAFGADSRKINGASPYMANSLSNCTLDGISVVIDLSLHTYTFDIPIRCTGSGLPFSLSFASRFFLDQQDPYFDDITSYYIRNRPAREGFGIGSHYIRRNASSPDNIVGILDAISLDLEIALQTLEESSADTVPTMIKTGGFLSCPGGLNYTCKPEDARMTILRSLLVYPNGSSIGVGGVGSFLAPAEKHLLNMLTVLKDAYLIDVGNIQPYNTLLNKDAFSARIKPDPDLSRVIAHKHISLWSLRLGWMHNSTWVDQLLAWNQDLRITVPSILPTGSAPTVIKFDYLCPVFKIKNTGSLITSVFIATWTMCTALYGLFQVVGPTLEKHYGRGQIDAREAEVGEVEEGSFETKRLCSQSG
ncbi:hypothetical protein FRC06_008380 [Ceratobasidium sp. 370]|nr:hypothetical protein FRC06_008380 [Ceratobasidium sp. 370]